MSLALLLVAAFLGPAAAQETFSDITDVIVVDIPVQVLIGSQPLRGLTADDFEVRDGRKQRQILDFEAIDLADKATVETSHGDVTAPARRHFLFLFDLAASDPHAILRARQAAREVVADSLHPTDLVAVGTYSVSGTQLLLGFTPDREQIEVAIDTLGMRSMIYGSRDPLGIVLSDAPPGALPVPSTPGGLNVEAELSRILTSMQAGTANAVGRASILAMTSSLGALAEMIGTVRGHKHVVFFSEGFDSSIPLGLGVEREVDRQAAASQAASAMSGRYWEVKSDVRFGNTSTLASIDEMAKSFVRSGAVVHTVDIAAIRPDSDLNTRRASSEGLFVIADKTGGEFYRNYNDLTAAIGKLLDRTSVTYVLTIQPTGLPPTGRYRELTVKLKNKPKGARIVHRPGYYAPKPFTEQSPLERRLTTAELLLGEREGGSVGLEVETTPLVGGGTGLDLAVHVDGPSLLREMRGKVFPAEFFAYAIDSKGKVRDFDSRTIKFDLDTIGRKLREDGYLIHGKLDLPPGEYSLRTLIRNTITGKTGLRITTVTVPSRTNA